MQRTLVKGLKKNQSESEMNQTTTPLRYENKVLVPSYFGSPFPLCLAAFSSLILEIEYFVLTIKSPTVSEVAWKDFHCHSQQSLIPEKVSCGGWSLNHGKHVATSHFTEILRKTSPRAFTCSHLLWFSEKFNSLKTSNLFFKSHQKRTFQSVKSY